MLSKKEMLAKFPAKKFRKYQKETVEKIAEGLQTGVKCVLLSAPTGFGKSIVNTTVCRSFKDSFYATPQLNLIDQILKDKNIGTYFKEVRGRQNYWCTYDPYATVNLGVCTRNREFRCDRLWKCPYWKKKVKALNSPIALMSFAYFMLEGRTETEYSFKRRAFLCLDEAHSVDSHVLSHVSFTVSPWTVPFSFYEDIRHLITDFRNSYEVVAFVKTVLEAARSRFAAYEQMTLLGTVLTIPQAEGKNKVQDFISSAEHFLESSKRTEWVWWTDWVSYHGKPYRRFRAMPVYARTFMSDMVWSRAEYYMVSSATILDPQSFVYETGLDLVLDADQIMHLSVPSTFPPENRPIIDSLDGKLTYAEREENLPEAVKILEKIIELESGKNTAVHCHSYGIAIAIENLISPKYKSRLITHTSVDRKEALEKWKGSKGKVFICVAFEEGYDWIGDLCECQVLFKVPYQDIKDRRVARRLEKGDWDWYFMEALKTTIQSYGRAVRTPTDKANFYVIDRSFVDLMRRTKGSIPEWFAEAMPAHWKKLVGVK